MMKQKKGFLLFLCSLIPGAGELYMGFKKQGISTMAVCGGVFALTSMTGFGWLMVVLPILWAYSFFYVHNLKSMPEEEFKLQQDEYILNIGYMLENKRELLVRYRAVIATVMIFIGLSSVWDTFGSVLYHLLPMHMIDMFYEINDILKNVILATVFIGGGIYLAFNKEKWQELLERK